MSESQEFFTLTAWSNSGSDEPNGFRILKADRERLFKRLKSQLIQEGVIIEFPSGKSLRLPPIVKPSFWSKCPEFINSEIGAWIIGQDDHSWPKGEPPKYIAELLTTVDGAIKIKVLRKQ